VHQPQRRPDEEVINTVAQVLQDEERLVLAPAEVAARKEALCSIHLWAAAPRPLSPGPWGDGISALSYILPTW
jgi:hypothetical protein